MKFETENMKHHHSLAAHEPLFPPAVDLQPLIRAFHFLVRQMSRLLPFTHPLLVFPLLFGENVAYDYNGFETSSTAPGDNANKNDTSSPPKKPTSSEIPAKNPGQKPGILKPGALPITTGHFQQERKAPGKISFPGHTWFMQNQVNSIRFLTKYARDNFPGEFKGNQGGLSIPVIEVFNRRTFEIKENDTLQYQQNPSRLKESEGESPGVYVSNRGAGSSKESHVIKAVKNVRFIDRLVQETQKQKQQPGPIPRIPFSLNVYGQEKMDPGSTVINKNHREYRIGFSSLHPVNRGLGFLNEVVQPSVVQVRLEEETEAISHPVVEKIHIDRADHVNHVNHVKLLQDKVLRSATQFASIREIQERAGGQNTFQTSVVQAIRYIPMPAKHFLETRWVDTAAGASSMFVRMKTYNIAPSLTSLAAAGNVLLENLVSCYMSNDDEPSARRAIKSFSGGPGGRFFKKVPLAAGGTFSPLLKSLAVCNDRIQAHFELSTAVIVEKMYARFANGTKGGEANLNFNHGRDNQTREVANTFNVTMNVNANSSFIEGDAGSLRDMGEKLAEILTEEARRYGIKV
jgi:hypothetical protein